ncbi:hypothetical protein ACFTZK_21370 [Streptomyces decoyicus]|uniref:hypothetical protein n=1 Tax=Streptomyces decoyicus TaxID=249567 RepID=UPI00362DCD36
MANGDVKLLGHAARTPAEAGAHLYAAEGFAELARMHRQDGLDRSPTAATAQARTLLLRCDDVATPPLDFLGTAASLSLRERTVARLAAQRLTDKEIATRLLSRPAPSGTPCTGYRNIGARDRRDMRQLLSA